MQTHRINLEEYDAEAYPQGYVDIKERRSWGDSNRIAAAGFGRVEASGTNGTATGSMAFDAAERVLVEVETALVAWSLSLPANRDGLLSDEFDEGLGDWLLAQIREHYESQKRTPEASLKPNASSNGSTKASRAGQPSST